jgi:hypothetical protein
VTRATVPQTVAIEATRPTRKAKLVVMVLLVLCTLGARLPGLLHDALWQDEIGVERVISQPSVADAITTIVHRESTPPAFYLLARAANRVVPGLEPAPRARAVRVLPLAFSLGCTILTFLLACELMPLWGAALAGVLAAFASQLVVHGSELRSYPLLAFVCVAFALALERAGARPSLARLMLLSLTVAFASLTHYFFLFTFMAGALWLFVSGLPRAALARVGVALAIGLVPLALWSPSWVRQYRNGIYGTAPRPFDLGRVLDLFPSLLAPQPFVTGTSLVTHPVTSVGAAMPVLVTLAVLVPGVLLLRVREGRLCGLLLVVPFGLVTSLVAVTGERVYSSRNLIGIAPFAATALAWGCVALPWRRVSYAAGLLVGALVVSGFVYGQINYGRTPYDRIAAVMIAQGFRPGEPIYWFGGSGGAAPVGWYLTSHEAADTWPRLVHARPRKAGACRALEVVARTQAGRDWLAQHAGAVLAEASLPQYGDVPQAARQSVDARVARVRFSPGILERRAGATNMLLLRVAGTPSPCVR